MEESGVKRKLAAILAADVAGYSRLMGADEQGTLDRLHEYRQTIDQLIDEHHGRFVGSAGDSVLAEFASSVDVVSCAWEIQKSLGALNESLPEGRRMEFRIGVNLGDVLVEGPQIYGDGVNVAARMEALAEPGTICVSGNVHEHIGTALDIGFEDLGAQLVKNIDQPIHSYRVLLDEHEPTVASKKRRTVTDKPSITVLPFENMSGDPEQEFFADGMAEDIITGLSRYRSLFVIARNSTFAYKGQSPDLRNVSRDLGVKYVLEGSMRKAGSRIRVTAQLIDGTTGSHIWAERYDRELHDIFALQDEITETIVAAIGPEIDQVERERAQRLAPDSLDAWESYLGAV